MESNAQELSIGFIVGVNLVTDFIKERFYKVTDYRNALGQHRAIAYLWEDDKPCDMWFVFRSRRQAHSAMKRRAARKLK